MIILGITLIVIGFFVSVLTLYFTVTNNSDAFITVYLSGMLLISGALVLNEKPTEQDIIDGKAIYQETQIITGNDTIKMYDIIWKK